MAIRLRSSSHRPAVFFLRSLNCLLDAFAHKKALRLRAEKILELFLAKGLRECDYFCQEAAGLWTDVTSVRTERKDGRTIAIIQTNCSGNGFSGYRWFEPIPEWLFMSDRRDDSVHFDLNLFR
jgi:hypothetical protein